MLSRLSLRKHPFLLALRRWGRVRAKRPQRRRAWRNGCFRRLLAASPLVTASPKSHSTILQRLRRQISLDYHTIPPATQASVKARCDNNIVREWQPHWRVNCKPRSCKSINMQQPVIQKKLFCCKGKLVPYEKSFQHSLLQILYFDWLTLVSSLFSSSYWQWELRESQVLRHKILDKNHQKVPFDTSFLTTGMK